MRQAPKQKMDRFPVHGVLLLDKPLTFSSNQALQKVKWLLQAEKAGHTGTLDPLASGVLPLCFGAATKFAQIHLDADKVYEAIIRLGIKTSSGDAEGQVVSVRPVTCDIKKVQAVLASFLGEQWQTPPMNSALKQQGIPLYELARKGLVVDRLDRRVCIHELELLAVDLDVDEPSIRIQVACSKGTYIRTLGEDIGEKLGCGGHLSFLRRLKTGHFSLQDCVTIEVLERLTREERLDKLLAPDYLLTGFEKVFLNEADADHFQHGLQRRGAWHDQALVAVYDQSKKRLLGTASVTQGVLQPVRLLSKEEFFGESSPKKPVKNCELENQL